jgi:hypothetical protein
MALFTVRQDPNTAGSEVVALILFMTMEAIGAISFCAAYFPFLK